ncbi:MAG TPA: glycoside hydrolase family 3 N-terminal domain-containing protein [Propionibacteriaceae bacterium]
MSRLARLRPGLVCAVTISALSVVSCSAPPQSEPSLGPASAHTGTLSAAPSASGTPASPTPDVGPPASSSSPKPEPATCAELASKLTLDEQIGQLLMVGVGSMALSQSEADTLADVRAGSAVLLGNSSRGREHSTQVVTQVREAMASPDGVRPIVAVDQEGGQVQRLRGDGYTRIPSATAQARQSDRTLTRNAAAWGKQLRQTGIEVDLAPVADVVPAELTRVNAPIGRLDRGYGSSPEVVADKVTAFARGMDDAGVVTAVKHFPGLGRVRGNTDFSTHVVDSVTTRKDAGLAGFRAAIRADVPMVMISSAYYSKIDADHRAAFSSVVITDLLRGDLGFTGVVISDDLSAAAMRDVSPGDRAVRFVQAGGDLAIVGDPSQARATAAGLKAKAKGDKKFARQVAGSAARVLAMKADADRASCGD